MFGFRKFGHKGKEKRSRWVDHHSDRIGLPPGTFFVKETVDKSVSIEPRIIIYSKDSFERYDGKLEIDRALVKDDRSTWIDIPGLYDLQLLEGILNRFNIHPLVMEDIVHPAQRPKYEDYGDYIFVVTRMLQYDETTGAFSDEQVSFLLGKNLLLSFQETAKDVFDPIRRRLEENRGRIRRCGPDYLLYSLLDAITDNYFFVLEKLGEETETLDNEVMASPDNETFKRIHIIKREILYIRKIVRPSLEFADALKRESSPIIHHRCRPFLRDLVDHLSRINDSVNNLWDLLDSVQSVYLATVSNRLNETMRVLTVFASLFIPLTLITGIYGMNFTNMPELNWHYGYFLCLALMVVVAVVILAWFRRNRWI